jgi:DNA-binding NarL/FixJ family response regulator
MSDSDEPIRVLVADDHPIFLAGMRQLLDTQPLLECVGEAANGKRAIELATALLPDVAVLDLNMPELNGVEAARAISRNTPTVAVLVLTMLEDDDSVFAAMRAGARGYLLKGAGPAELVHAIHTIAGGASVFGPSIAHRILEYFATPRPAELFADLTAREREILDLIADGHGNASIAGRLHLSPKTVRNHVSNIFAKLQVADRAEAMLRARRAGLGHP